jgi:glycosyltransferase involved in cell wall biosynthesis
VHIVRCTVGSEFLAPAPIDPESSQFLCIGRLSAQKGQAVLIDAFATLIESGVDAQLILAGDGELRAEIENRIAKHGLHGRVRITGWIAEQQIRELLLRSRALVLPSFAEGLPVVIMEALGMGRPVISTYVAGIPELVRPGENGWLVTAGRADQLAAAMREALESPVKHLEALGRAGSALVAERHRTSSEAARLAGYLASVVEPKRGGMD